LAQRLFAELPLASTVLVLNGVVWASLILAMRSILQRISINWSSHKSCRAAWNSCYPKMIAVHSRHFKLSQKSLAAASLALAATSEAHAATQSKPDSATKEAPSTEFQGKVALVTGAAKGMGREISRRLIESGARVILVDLDEKSLQENVAAMGPRASYVACDLRKLDEARAMFEKMGCADEVDLLVNCAGVAIFQEFAAVTEDVWDMTMEVNAKAVFFLSQYFAKGMAKKGSGSIVNISSQSSGIVVSTKHHCYSTSKAAVDHITRLSAISLAKSNIRVNAVNPTVVRTELAIKAHGEEGLKKMAAKIPLGKICECDDVADAVLFLLSDKASMITGVTLPVDGGFIASRP